MKIRLRIEKKAMLLSVISSIIVIGVLMICFKTRLYALFFGGIFAISAFLKVEFTEHKFLWLSSLIIGIATAIICFVSSQWISEPDSLKNMELRFALWNIICYFGIFAFIYIISCNAKISSVCTVALSAFLSVVNEYVIEFRGTALKIADILAVKTAMAVVDTYELFLKKHMVAGLAIVIMWLIFLSLGISIEKSHHKQWQQRVSASVICVISA